MLTARAQEAIDLQERNDTEQTARCAARKVIVSPQVACPLHAASLTDAGQHPTPDPTPDQSYSVQSG